MDIANKTVLITGANRGIGRALVDEALRRGAKEVYAGVRGALQIADQRVTPLALDVTNLSQIRQAAEQVDSLDVLINNAGVAIYDDLSNPDVIQQHLAVNFFGVLNSMAGLAPLPIIPAYSLSKAAAFNMTQSLRAHLAAQGVTVHAVVLGPIDTDMNRGFEVPKATPAAAAQGIFDGLEKDEEEIFPDPVSQSIADGWRNGTLKALEREFKAFVPQSAAN